MDKALAEFDPVQYTFYLRHTGNPRTNNGFPTLMTGTQTVRKSGTQKFVESFVSSSLEGGEPGDAVTMRTVVNDRYSAWSRENTMPLQFLPVPSSNELSQRGKGLVEIGLGDDLLNLAYGDDKHSLRALIKVVPAGTWSAQRIGEDADDGLIRITYQRSQKTVCTFDIDPRHGFMVVHKVTYNDTGSIESEVKTTPRRFAEHWFPGEVQWDRRKGETIAYSMHYETATVELDPAQIDADFEMKSLLLPEGTLVAEESANGRLATRIWTMGQLVSAGTDDAIPEANPSTRQAEKTNGSASPPLAPKTAPLVPDSTLATDKAAPSSGAGLRISPWPLAVAGILAVVICIYFFKNGAPRT